MKLNEEETTMVYTLFWAISNGWITPMDLLDNTHTADQYKALWERIKDETDLGWADEGELNFKA